MIPSLRYAGTPFGQRLDVADDADDQTKLLAFVGRQV
jgi:hypothetical protein